MSRAVALLVPNTRELLRTRWREVSAYLDFLNIAVEKNAVLSVTAGHTPATYPIHGITKWADIVAVFHWPPITYPIHGVTNTLKANLCLLLYNAMEAMLVELMDEIHCAISHNATSVDELHADLLLEIICSFKNSKKEVDNTIAKKPRVLGSKRVRVGCP